MPYYHALLPVLARRPAADRGKLCTEHYGAPPIRPLRESLLLSAVVIAIMMLGAVVLWAATEGLWLLVHQGLQ